jgi:DNA-binding transcriptional LysR family regulator
MATTEPNWDLYRSFLAVLKAGSLSGAARELGLAQPTLGRHIDALEQSIGLALFLRSQHGFLPTEHARQLQPYAESLAATASAFLRAASGQGDTVSGTVRVTASEVIGCEVLPPILLQLQRDWPALKIELALSNRTQDLLRREADIAVRMVRPVQEALVARRIGEVELGLHAHRDYLARCGAPATLEALQAHAVIGFDHESAFIRSVKHHLGGLAREHLALRTDSDMAQLAAGRAGLGIFICQNRIGQRDPNLVRLLPEAFALKLDTWVAMHEDLRSSRRCNVVFHALADGLASYIAG